MVRFIASIVGPRCLCLMLLGFLTCVARAGEPATAPTTSPPLTDRQASLLMQLAESEANIRTINQALVRTGYKVGLAYQKIEAGQQGNQLMDRQGGGPVAWDRFYGSTAAGFNYHSTLDIHAQRARGYNSVDLQANGSQLTPIERPQQFDYIYRANDQQIAHAQEQIASLSQNQAALLARRQQHEMNQSRLWAEFSWEQVRDQEIGFRPLYRFKLQPDDLHSAVLRGPILFLRTADKALAVSLDSMDGDQRAVFAALAQHMKAAYGALQESMADVLYSPQLTPSDAKDGDGIKTICKNVTEECNVVADNLSQAMQSDAAREDASKLAYRAQLQSSLARLSTLMSDLDHRITSQAAAWHVTPVSGVASTDALPVWPALAAATAPPLTAAIPATPALPLVAGPGPAIAVKPSLTAGGSLLDALSIKTDATCERREDCLQVGIAGSHFDGHVTTEAEFATPLVITAVAKNTGRELRLFFGDRGIMMLSYGAHQDGLRQVDPRTGRSNFLSGNGAVPDGQFSTIRWTIADGDSRVEVNGEERGAFHGDYHGLVGRVGIGTHGGGKSIVTVKSLSVNREPMPSASQTPPAR